MCPVSGSRCVLRLLELLDALPDLGGFVDGERPALLGKTEELDHNIQCGDLVVDLEVGQPNLGFGGFGGPSIIGAVGSRDRTLWRRGKM
mgnify:CR=1 FL=1